MRDLYLNECSLVSIMFLQRHNSYLFVCFFASVSCSKIFQLIRITKPYICIFFILMTTKQIFNVNTRLSNEVLCVFDAGFSYSKCNNLIVCISLLSLREEQSGGEVLPHFNSFTCNLWFLLTVSFRPS